MNIGIDFDNTIVWYDISFREVALSEGFIDGNWKGKGKTDLRDHLRQQLDGERTWMILQGLVYGKYMHGAEMMPGVANFLMSCNVRNLKVFIVSHKTEYGHFDPEMISLRSEALKWMEVRRFFDPKYFGLSREDVFFADTRKEKVNLIDSINCGWFIDDLPEVFEENHFPDTTCKILFGSYKPEQFQNRSVLNSWRKISEKILGQITDQDVVFWVKGVVNHSLEHVEKIPGQGNSSIYKIHVSGEKSYALKYYPDRLMDDRPRLKTEFNTLRLLHKHNITNIPKAVEKSDDLNLGLYEWVNGEKVIEPANNDIDQAIDFVKKLYSLSRKIDENDIDLASEACLSAGNLISQIEKRLSRLKLASNNFSELSTFLEHSFEPLWAQVRDKSIALWPLESVDNNLPKKKLILSPSDFGFHNCLKSDKGILIFIDFDYFGWDDPVKLTADFLWHPAMNLNTKLKEKWQETMLELFSEDINFEARLNAAMPLYGLRWALIVLNEYLPGFADRRKDAGKKETYNIDKTRKIQLNKAEHYYESVITMVSQTGYA